MKIIGNILSDKQIEYDPRIKTVGTLDEIDPTVPTLIIGWEKARDLFPEDFSSIEKNIKDEIFWTFKLIEKRNEYEIDLETFINYCFEYTVKNIEYIFIDPIQFRLKTIKKIIDKIKSIDNLVSFQHGDTLFIYGEGIIFGIDLHLLDFYFDIKKDKLKSKIKTLCKGTLLDDEILIKYKDYLARLDSIKYIPYLHHIENE